MTKSTKQEVQKRNKITMKNSLKVVPKVKVIKK